ncbi:MAG: DUF192 domain-containing protein [Xenococcaceae cyanobacterium]
MKILSSVLLFFFLSPVAIADRPDTSVNVFEAENLGQVLPVTATAIMGGETIELEVAQTPQQQALGLMYRKSLADNRGMLFSFEEARIAQFWMKNCLIPLDMIFLKEGKIVEIVANAPPCQSNPCPVYGPLIPVDGVIELREGRAAQLGLKVRDSVLIQPVKKVGNRG